MVINWFVVHHKYVNVPKAKQISFKIIWMAVYVYEEGVYKARKYLTAIESYLWFSALYFGHNITFTCTKNGLRSPINR